MNNTIGTIYEVPTFSSQDLKMAVRDGSEMDKGEQAMNGFEDVSDSAARLVSRHLISLVGDARRSGVPLHEITIELAAHAACAALSFWSVDDLHALIDVADEDDVTPPGSLPSVDLPSLVGSLRRTPH